ncbi:MAG TPA: DUF29 family protein [Telluria sp.]
MIENPIAGTGLNEERNQIEDRIEDSPSLRRELKGYIDSRYPRVAKRALLQTGLPVSTFPAACPYTVDQLLDQDFLP